MKEYTNNKEETDQREDRLIATWLEILFFILPQEYAEPEQKKILALVDRELGLEMKGGTKDDYKKG